MSKIGRKPININNVAIEVKGSEVHYKGPKASGTYTLPENLEVRVDGQELFLTVRTQGDKKTTRDENRIWGLHRALLANAISGAQAEFEVKLEINGLGYKAQVSGKKVVFSLGYSHKTDFELPEGVAVVVDKSGQKLTVMSSNKVLAGLVSSKIKALRMPEPYKGTGIKYATEELIRKAGKTKAS